MTLLGIEVLVDLFCSSFGVLYVNGLTDTSPDDLLSLGGLGAALSVISSSFLLLLCPCAFLSSKLLQVRNCKQIASKYGLSNFLHSLLASQGNKI